MKIKSYLIAIVMFVLLSSVSVFAEDYDMYNKTYTCEFAMKINNTQWYVYQTECTGAIPIFRVTSQTISGTSWYIWQQNFMTQSGTLVQNLNGVSGVSYRWRSITTTDLSKRDFSKASWNTSTGLNNQFNSIYINDFVVYTGAFYLGNGYTYDEVFNAQTLPFWGGIAYWYTGNYYNKTSDYSPDIYYPVVESWKVAYTPEFLNSENYCVYSDIDFSLGGTSNYATNDINIELWCDRNGKRTMIYSTPLTSIQKDNNKYDLFSYVYGNIGGAKFNMEQFQNDFDNYKNIKLLVRLSVDTTTGRTLVSSYSYIDVPVYKLTGSYKNGLWSADVYYAKIIETDNQSFDNNDTELAVGDDVIFKPNNGINYGNTYNVTDFNFQDFTTSANGLKNLVSGMSAILVYVPAQFWTVLLMGLTGFITIAMIKGLTG